MIRVVLRGSHGGELDFREVSCIEDVSAAVAEMAQDCVLAFGDTITIEGDES